MSWDKGWGEDQSNLVTTRLCFKGSDGLWAVDCIIIGDLAVHKTKDGWEWTVSHVPTYARFDNAFPEDKSYSKDQLIKWCEAVQKDMEELWASIRELTPDNFQDKPMQRLALRDYCRSIEIE